MPTLTHLQFLILSSIAVQQCSGLAIRGLLDKAGESKSGPAFYQLMARMEDSGWVVGEYRQKEIGGQLYRERWYKITRAGKAAVKEVVDFYTARLNTKGASNE